MTERIAVNVGAKKCEVQQNGSIYYKLSITR